MFISLTLPSFFTFLEYWLRRITDKLIMIGSQFIHMFTASLGRHTANCPRSEHIPHIRVVVVDDSKSGQRDKN